MAQEFLSSMLPRRGPEAFGKFIAALMSCKQQQFIAKKLDPELAKWFESTEEPGDDDVDTGNAAKSDEQIINEVKGCVSILCLVD